MNNTHPSTSSNSVGRCLDAIAEFTGTTTAWLTGIMVIIACIVVGLRHVFDIGSIALQESVTYMHAAVFMLGAAYTLKNDGHVRVDIVHKKMSPRARGHHFLTYQQRRAFLPQRASKSLILA